MKATFSRRQQHRRRGTTLVESALVYSVLFLVVIGILQLGVMVFRYHQMAHIAREASRWASVHGAKYAEENNVTAATPADIYTNAILPRAIGLDTSKITYAVTWDTDAAGNPVKTPSTVERIYNPTTGTYTDKYISNPVTVKVTYTWNYGFFGTIPVTSTSSNIISY